MTQRLIHLFSALLFATTATAGEFPEPYNTESAEKAPMSAQEAADSATLPEGFRLEVFAAEPEVQQPISIAFDSQDRLWVAECYTFAERPMRWDMELRDRILVLEDTDKDGKADKRTVFWDEGTRLTSAVPGRGGVWATCSPHLLFIPDKDGDLVPDGDPVVMLDGFDAETIGHNIVNGLKWGPDGWLYGRHGITSTSFVGRPGTPQSRRIAINCSIWRFHPETLEFEVFCQGGTNPWGLDWDENGQLFYTNTVIGHLWHAIPGAYYKRMFGSHLNRYAYELIPHTADHYHWDTGTEKWSDAKKEMTDSTSRLGGGHAHMGCLIYQGGVWPEKYHGNLFTCNLHGRRVNQEILKREGVGYVAHHEEDFLMMEDPWFRGLDLITGPDGQVWMNDWSDTGECHDNDAIHRTSGRIYRIVYDGPDKGEISYGRPEWFTARGESDFERGDIEALLESGEEAKRALGVRWLSEDHPEEVAQLLEIAKQSPEPLVRLELASSLQRIPLRDRFALATVLSQIEEDADDRQQPLLIWYGVEKAVPEYRDLAKDLALQSRHPKVTRLIARRLAEDVEERPDAVADLLSQASGAVANSILAGLREGLNGWSEAPMPSTWDSFVQQFDGSSDESIKEAVGELALLFGDGRAREDLIKIVKTRDGDAAARRAALQNLLRQPDDELLVLLRSLVNDKILGVNAIRGFANYDAPDIPGRVIAFWQRYPLHRSASIDTLVSRPSYASALLAAVKNGTVPRDAISPYQARQILNFGDEALLKELSEVWGEIRETPEEKIAEIEEWKKQLSPDSIAAADPVRGKQLFAGVCGSCHKLYGEGGQIGPDLTGSDRHSLDYLLENTINPNDVVPADYLLTVFTMSDGRVISGVVPEENEKTIFVQAAAEKIPVKKENVKKRETLPISLMPEGLLKAMKEEEVQDLIAYLMTNGPIE